jgi:hypothetical protein
MLRQKMVNMVGLDNQESGTASSGPPTRLTPNLVHTPLQPCQVDKQHVASWFTETAALAV